MKILRVNKLGEWRKHILHGACGAELEVELSDICRDGFYFTITCGNCRNPILLDYTQMPGYVRDAIPRDDGGGT